VDACERCETTAIITIIVPHLDSAHREKRFQPIEEFKHWAKYEICLPISPGSPASPALPLSSPASSPPPEMLSCRSRLLISVAACNIRWGPFLLFGFSIREPLQCSTASRTPRPVFIGRTTSCCPNAVGLLGVWERVGARNAIVSGLRNKKSIPY